MEEKLALLYRFEQFCCQLPAAVRRQKKVMVTDIDGALQSLAYLEKCQREAAAEGLKLGLDCCKLTRRKISATGITSMWKYYFALVAALWLFFNTFFRSPW